ncbi:PTS sugar transporter subunit IIB [Clostridium beijerinckii]|uniref:Fructoselysine and glucoselysine-specific PTS system IIB component n=1 Tax=Clostridium beijerinckii TaxID=1520 RepID=A0A7Y9D5B4_CLOBE|nr:MULTISPECIES: PTS sugar transporter subunit IIB [Clostridium]ALB47759.1 PTS mannose/fructose/sorbose transporter subunit IIB [Clostridium beijerinckii NRRL B-598]AVK49988.1 PTS sugar transporter [Clostridium sp. MF28]NMF03514.1 PTS sugar transporter subunit IIB [Clostridium beijerinckii]NRT89418.1 fructoselysine and glucoselysine-specific PTS system IIB component [Clostridium beijerinckii]NYC74874.1 fructoselysine and glucoselysine-specific PTS system IIB component [Clostridium beijerinckii
MIKLLRVDYRLLHGQVALAWTQQINTDCILIANDKLMQDEIKKTTIKLAKPNGVKLVIKNIEDSIAAIKSGVTDKYKLFIIVETIEDAAKLSNELPDIKSINIGGVMPREGTRTITKSVPISKEEERILQELINRDVELEIRQVPGDKKILVKNVL